MQKAYWSVYGKSDLVKFKSKIGSNFMQLAPVANFQQDTFQRVRKKMLVHGTKCNVSKSLIDHLSYS